MIFVYSPQYVVELGGHVFPTKKFTLVAELLKDRGEFIDPQLPSREDLLLAHDAVWIDKILSGQVSLEDEVAMELPFGPALSQAHRLQVSGTILACRSALDRGLGLHIGGGSHHAFRDHGEGFCVLNDIACGILNMRAGGRIERAAVIDLDVHQGNGTASIFNGQKDVFTFSMHQENLYPAVKEKSSLDVGLAARTEDEEYLEILKRNLPAVFSHRPELIVYQAGVDCAEGDLLGGLGLTPEGLKARDAMVYEACRVSGTPLAVTLGGGYAEDIAITAGLHAQTLLTALEAFSPADKTAKL